MPRSNWVAVARFGVLLLTIGFCLLFILIPKSIHWMLARGFNPDRLASILDWVQLLQTFAMHGFVHAWITVVGTCFGSFLNVVALRTPRGRSIVGPSQCPHCDVRLSLKDNIPVWGWIKNDGRCRHCQQPISMRYVLVEVAFGCIFLMLFTVEVTFSGINLPCPPPINSTGQFVLISPNWQLIMTFVFHATLAGALFVQALATADSMKIPNWIHVTAGLLLILIFVARPDVVQLPWASFDTRHSSYGDGLGQSQTIVFGLIAGICVGCGANRWLHRRRSQIIQNGDDPVGPQMAGGFGLVGLALGWQSLAVIFPIWAGGLMLIQNWIAGKKQVISACNESSLLLSATLLHLLTWKLTTGFLV